MAGIFGVKPETFVLYLSLAFFSILFLFSIIILAFSLWLRKVNLQVKNTVKYINSRKEDNWLQENKAFGFAYSGTDLNEEDHCDSVCTTSFEGKRETAGTEMNDLRPDVNGNDQDEPVVSNVENETSDQSFAQHNDLNLYTSIKSPCKLKCNTFGEAGTFRLTDAVDAENNEGTKAKVSSTGQTDDTYENEYLLIIGKNYDESVGLQSEVQGGEKTEKSNEIDDPQAVYENGYLEIIHGEERTQIKGTDFKFLENDKTDGPVEIDSSQPEYENGYLEVLHSDECHNSNESLRDVKSPRQDEAGYLIPIESFSTELKSQEEDYDVPLVRENILIGNYGKTS